MVLKIKHKMFFHIVKNCTKLYLGKLKQNKYFVLNHNGLNKNSLNYLDVLSMNSIGKIPNIVEWDV